MIILIQIFVHDHLTVLPLVYFLYLLYLNKLSKHAIFCCLRSIPVSYAVFYAHCTVKAPTVSIAQHFDTNNKLCCKFEIFYHSRLLAESWYFLGKTVFSLLFKLVYPLIPHKPFLYISFSAICLQLEHIKHIKYPQLSMFSSAYKFYIGYELIRYVKFIMYNYAFVKLTCAI